MDFEASAEEQLAGGFEAAGGNHLMRRGVEGLLEASREVSWGEVGGLGEFLDAGWIGGASFDEVNGPGQLRVFGGMFAVGAGGFIAPRPEGEGFSKAGEHECYWLVWQGIHADNGLHGVGEGVLAGQGGGQLRQSPSGDERAGDIDPNFDEIDAGGASCGQQFVAVLLAGVGGQGGGLGEGIAFAIDPGRAAAGGDEVQLEQVFVRVWGDVKRAVDLVGECVDEPVGLGEERGGQAAKGVAGGFERAYLVSGHGTMLSEAASFDKVWGLPIIPPGVRLRCRNNLIWREP